MARTVSTEEVPGALIARAQFLLRLAKDQNDEGDQRRVIPATPVHRASNNCVSRTFGIVLEPAEPLIYSRHGYVGGSCWKLWGTGDGRKSFIGSRTVPRSAPCFWSWVQGCI